MVANALKYIKENYNTTILITSHDVKFLNDVVDKYIVINKGRIQDSFDRANLSPESIEEKYKDLTNGEER